MAIRSRRSVLNLSLALMRLAMALAPVLVMPAIGCRRSRQLPVHEGCRTPEVVSCLQSYALQELDLDALEQLDAEVVWGECLAKDKKRLQLQASCLPLEMGVDRQTGEMVELRYFFRPGLPPPRGGVVPLYSNKIYRERCCEIGGAPLMDIAASRYLGCMPLVSRTREHRERVCGRSH